MTTRKTYEELQHEVRQLQDRGILPTFPTNEQRADWAYGNTVIENDQVTLDMAKRAVELIELPPARKR